MKKYKNSLYPQKANDFIDNEGNFLGGDYIAGQVEPIITEPTQDNTSDKIQVVLLSKKPQKYFAGYLYLINLANYPIQKIVTHGQLIGPDTIRETAEVSLELIAENGYVLPKNIDIQGATFTYNNINGEIWLSNPTQTVIINATCPQLYNIQYNIQHGSWYGDERVTVESPANAILFPDEGYYLPKDIAPDFELINANYQYDINAKSLKIIQPIADVQVNINCVLPYSININILHGSVSGDTSIIPWTGEVQLYLTADQGYYKPATIIVENASYTYDTQTGSIVLFHATNDVIIQIECVEPYTVTTNINHGDIIGDTFIQPVVGQLQLEIIPEEGYYCPVTIEVQNASYTYNRQTGIIQLSNATNNVIININCIAPFIITNNCEHTTWIGPATVLPWETIQGTILTEGDYELNSIQITGATYNYQLSNDHLSATITISSAQNNIILDGSTSGFIGVELNQFAFPSDSVNLTYIWRE